MTALKRHISMPYLFFAGLLLMIMSVSFTVSALDDEKATQAVLNYVLSQDTNTKNIDDFAAFHTEIKRIATENSSNENNMNLLRAAKQKAVGLDLEKLKSIEGNYDQNRITIAKGAQRYALETGYRTAKTQGKAALLKYVTGLSGVVPIGSWANDGAIMDFTKDIDLTLDHLDKKIAGKLQSYAEDYINKKLGKNKFNYIDLDIVTTSTGHERKAGVFVDKSSIDDLVFMKLIRDVGGKPGIIITFNDDGTYTSQKVTAKEYIKQRFFTKLARDHPKLRKANGDFIGFQEILKREKAGTLAEGTFKDLKGYINKNRLTGSSRAFGVTDMLVHHEGEGREGKYDLETGVQKSAKYADRGRFFLRQAAKEMPRVVSARGYTEIVKNLELGSKITEAKSELAKVRKDIKAYNELNAEKSESIKKLFFEGDVDAFNIGRDEFAKDEINHQKNIALEAKIVLERDVALKEHFKDLGFDFPGIANIKTGDDAIWRKRYLDSNRNTILKLSNLVVEQSAVEIFNIKDQKLALQKTQDMKKRFALMVQPEAGIKYHGLGGDENVKWAGDMLKAYAALENFASRPEDWKVINQHKDWLLAGFTPEANIVKVIPQNPFHHDLANNQVGKAMMSSLDTFKSGTTVTFEKGKVVATTHGENGATSVVKGAPAFSMLMTNLRMESEKHFGLDKIKGASTLSSLDMAFQVMDLMPTPGELPSMKQIEGFIMLYANTKISYLGFISAIGEGKSYKEISEELVSIFFPIASIPKILKSLGDRTFKAGRSYIFDAQLDALYKASKFTKPSEDDKSNPNFRPKFVEFGTTMAEYQGQQGIEKYLKIIAGFKNDEGYLETGTVKDQTKASKVGDFAGAGAYLENTSVSPAIRSMIMSGEHTLFQKDPTLSQMTSEIVLQKKEIAELKKRIDANKFGPKTTEYRLHRFYVDGVLLSRDGKVSGKADPEHFAHSLLGLQDSIAKHLAGQILITFEERARLDGVGDAAVLVADSELATLAYSLGLEKQLLLPVLERTEEINTHLGFNVTQRSDATEKKSARTTLIKALDTYRRIESIQKTIVTMASSAAGIELKQDSELFPLTGKSGLVGVAEFDAAFGEASNALFEGLKENTVDDIEVGILEGREDLFALVSPKEIEDFVRLRFFAAIDETIQAGQKSAKSPYWMMVHELNLPTEGFAEKIVLNVNDENSIWGSSWAKSIGMAPGSANPKHPADRPLAEQLKLNKEMSTLKMARMRTSIEFSEQYAELRAASAQRLNLSAQRYWLLAQKIREKVSKPSLQVVVKPKEGIKAAEYRDTQVLLGIKPAESEASYTILESPTVNEDDYFVFSTSLTSNLSHSIQFEGEKIVSLSHDFDVAALEEVAAPEDNAAVIGIFPPLNGAIKRLTLEFEMKGGAYKLELAVGPEADGSANNMPLDGSATPHLFVYYQASQMPQEAYVSVIDSSSNYELYKSDILSQIKLTEGDEPTKSFTLTSVPKETLPSNTELAFVTVFKAKDGEEFSEKTPFTIKEYELTIGLPTTMAGDASANFTLGVPEMFVAPYNVMFTSSNDDGLSAQSSQGLAGTAMAGVLTEDIQTTLIAKVIDAEGRSAQGVQEVLVLAYVEPTDEDIWGDVPAEGEGEAAAGELSEGDEGDEGESWEDADKADDLITGDDDILSAYEMRNKLAQKAANDAASDEARNARKFSQVEEGREEERIRKAEKRAAWGNVLNTIAAGVAQAAVQIQAADQQLDRQLAANKKAYSTGSAFASINAQSSAISNCVSRKNSAPSNGFARMDPHATQMECAQEYRNSRPAKKPATQQRSNNNDNTNRGNEPNFDSLNYTGGNGGLNTGGNSREPKPQTSFGDNNNTDASNDYVPQKREKEKPLPVGQFSKECDSSGITLYYWDSTGRGGRDKCLSDKQYGQSTAFKICGVTFYSTQRSVNYGLRDLKGSNPKYTGVYTKNSPDLNQCHGQ